MSIDIDDMSEAELLELNHRIVARLQLLQQVRTHQTMLGFSLGTRVWFQPEGQARRYGVVTRFNKKTVAVVTDTGEHWKVTPSVLHKVTEANANSGSDSSSPGNSSSGNSSSGKVVPLRRK